MRHLALWTVAIALFFASSPAVADFPPPGAHSPHAKYWPTAKRWVTNFSPFSFEGHVVGLTPDGYGGVWFGIGSTIEHISRDGSMQNYPLPEWLWQVSGVARDGAGRLWFSLGQSGRIATIDRNNHIRTVVVVARKHWPDIRSLAFAPDGALWFWDYGRQSIGRRDEDGRVLERPMPDGEFATGMARCGSTTFASAQGPRGNTIYSVDAKLRFASVYALPLGADVSMACDGNGRLWFAINSRGKPENGYIDRAGAAHVEYSNLLAESAMPAQDGGVWFIGFRSAGSTPDPHSRAILVRKRNGATYEMTLPIYPYLLQPSIASTSDGTIWITTVYPHSVVRLAPQP